MPRGGKRAGAPGQSYGNRSDLNTNRALPIQTAPNQPYGVAAQQAQAQRQIPLATQPAPAGPTPTVPQPSPGPAGAPPTPLIPLDAPTQRPGEPLTTPPTLAPQPAQDVSSLINQLATSSPQSAELAQLAAYVNSGRG